MGFWLSLFIQLAIFVAVELMKPKPDIENAKPGGEGDFQFPTATEERSLQILFGTTEIPGPNMIWYGDIRTEAITVDVRRNIFSSYEQIVGFKYYVGIQLGLGHGEFGKILNWRVGDTELFNGSLTDGNVTSINLPKLFGGDQVGNGGMVGDLRFFAGSASQAVSDYLSTKSVETFTITNGGTGWVEGEELTVTGSSPVEAAVFRVRATGGGGVVTQLRLLDPGKYPANIADPSTFSTFTGGSGSGLEVEVTFDAVFQSEQGDTPAYRHTAYVLWEGGYVGNSTTIKPWSFVCQRIGTGPVSASFELVNSFDMNPANVIYEILIDDDWGLKQPISLIDTSNFASVGETLFNEGNGFSMNVDREMEATDLLRLVEQQIDGVVFQDISTGLWKIKLARNDYNIDTVPQLTEDTCEVISFSRGTWKGTINDISVAYTDRNDDYKRTYAAAQDMGNFQIQDFNTVATSMQFPGVKDRTLANSIAWRELRTQSYPLSKAQVRVDRSFYAVNPGDVVAFTDGDLMLTKLPMRIQAINYGTLDDSKITLDLVQDIFEFRAGAFADGDDTGWSPPSDTLLAFFSDEQLAFEAPRAFLIRDPSSFGSLSSKIWCGARARGPEAAFAVVQRNASGTPAGSFTEVAEGFTFMKIGELKSALASGSSYPLSTLLIETSPDDQATLNAAFNTATDADDLGTNLVNLILVDNEFMLVESAQTSGQDVQLNNVYRGALDSGQAGHIIRSDVYVLSAGGVLSDEGFPSTNNIDVKLLPRSIFGTLTEGDATTISFTLADRWRRPYPPSEVSLGGSAFPASVSLEATGTDETFGIDVSFKRRDFRIENEISQLGTDAEDIFPDHDTANTITHTIEVVDDPDGTPTSLFTNTVANTFTTDTLDRNEILKATDGVLPTRMRVDLKSSHTFESVVYASTQGLVFDFNVTTALTGDFNFGALDTNEVSNVYTATVAGTYSFSLFSALPNGSAIVEYRLNGGSFTTLISAGGTSGNIAGVVATDTIEIRHDDATADFTRFLTMTAPVTGQDGYAVLYS